MTQDELGNLVQVVAVLVALGASVSALWISARDRQNAQRIAEEDRATAIRHGQLLFEQEALLRLAQNLDRGGYSDAQVRRDKGAEAQALIGAIGKDRLPLSWELRIKKNRDELVAFIADESHEGFLRRAAEAHIALMDVSDEIAGLATSPDRPPTVQDSSEMHGKRAM